MDWRAGMNRLRNLRQTVSPARLMTIDMITLVTVAALTGLSERTLWRRFADGSLKRHARHGKSMIEFSSIAGSLCVPLDHEELAVVKRADAGDADAQAELGMIFLRHGRAKTALHWFELAARQNNAEAMHWLGRCHIAGEGVEPNDFVGIMWLAKAAGLGHAIARDQIDALKTGCLRRPPIDRDGI